MKKFIYEKTISKKETTSFSRRNTSIFGRWWWTIDQTTLISLVSLMLIGTVLVFSSSPSVANRLKLPTFFFVYRHLLISAPSLILLIGVSLLSKRSVRYFSSFLFALSFILLILTLFYGMEIKGAKRWLSFQGLSFQPSELMKPSFAILSSWLLAKKAFLPTFPGISFSFGLLILSVAPLLMQPDLGMTLVTLLIWLCELFVFGIPWIFITTLFGMGILVLLGSYIFLPHVEKRIDQFLDPSLGDPKNDLYQVQKSLDAFSSGGLFGKGPGEGIVKHHLPDAHADFIFPVAGEEFGLICCIAILAFFITIVARSLLRALNNSSLFIMLSVTGLVTQFGVQALINMASSLHLIPTKGMTLPFLSYGGSSSLALSLGMGLLLSLTRKRRDCVDIV